MLSAGAPVIAMASEQTHIICFGNALHGDDGFGPTVYTHLGETPLPPGVRLFCADTAGLGALACFEDCTTAIVVDALRGFGPPGSLHSLAAGELEGSDDAASANIHGAGVGSLLRLLPVALPTPPRVRVIGVEIATLSPFQPGLSAAVAARLPEALAHIRRLLA